MRSDREWVTGMLSASVPINERLAFICAIQRDAMLSVLSIANAYLETANGLENPGAYEIGMRVTAEAIAAEIHRQIPAEPKP